MSIMPAIIQKGNPGGGNTPPVGAPPVCSFNYDPYILNGTVAFYADTSSGTPTGWVWRVNGAIVSNAANMNYYFASNGTYGVQLTVSNPYGSDTHLVLQHVVSTLP